MAGVEAAKTLSAERGLVQDVGQDVGTSQEESSRLDLKLGNLPL